VIRNNREGAYSVLEGTLQTGHRSAALDHQPLRVVNGQPQLRDTWCKRERRTRLNHVTKLP
jgi:hypothetical protein